MENITQAGPPPAIGQREIRKAAETLNKYKQGKANLERRIVEDELWWELRHWEAMGRRRAKDAPQPSSAWLFNAILNKHADAMDNYPEPVVLPREQSDADSARVLSQVLPVILEQNNFEQTYSDGWWEKLKHGTAAYGVFWDPDKDSGLGDVEVRGIDLLKLFWEPGITDIQKSRNLFLVELMDTDVLERQYPQFAGKLSGETVDVKQYLYDDDVDVSDKSVVVDWYYKVKDPTGRTVLHYAKFVGDSLLFASENDPRYAQRGWYDHGRYPVVLDVMFPEKGTPVGFGYVAICKDPQMYIDRLSGNILENAMMATKRRYFASTSTNINREQFMDWNQPIVDVEGELDDARIREITCRPLDAIYVNVAKMKIDEMKDTAANRDFNSGSTNSGVTAASAIAALQEAGNKVSRDMIAASYRSHVAISSLCVELIRQFYDEVRSFRITGEGAGYRFVQLSNQALRDQPTGYGGEGELLFRRPVFDLRIVAQKKNPFSRMEQNERAKELYRVGFFDPQRAQESLAALDMMDFEGIDQVREQVGQGQTLLKRCMELTQQLAMMGGPGAVLSTPQGGQAPAQGQQVPAQGNRLARAVAQAQTPGEDYVSALARRASRR